MHIPDGFLSPAVWAPLDMAALPAVGWVARRAQKDTDERSIPLMGVMGAFVFAAQMINFPVGLGTSGHLVGGALLSIVLGPAAASVVLTAILVIQAFVFQDGGIMALGPNVFNMAIVGVLAGYLPYRLLGSRWKSGAIFLAGTTSVMASALLALSQLLLSGVRMPGHLLWASLGLFLASGLIEGAITIAAVRAIGRLNPAWVRDPKTAESRAWTVLAGAALVLVVAGVSGRVSGSGRNPATGSETGAAGCARMGSRAAHRLCGAGPAVGLGAEGRSGFGRHDPDLRRVRAHGTAVCPSKERLIASCCCRAVEPHDEPAARRGRPGQVRRTALLSDCCFNHAPTRHRRPSQSTLFCWLRERLSRAFPSWGCWKEPPWCCPLARPSPP